MKRRRKRRGGYVDAQNSGADLEASIAAADAALDARLAKAKRKRRARKPAT